MEGRLHRHHDLDHESWRESIVTDISALERAPAGMQDLDKSLDDDKNRRRRGCESIATTVNRTVAVSHLGCRRRQVFGRTATKFDKHQRVSASRGRTRQTVQVP